MHSSTCEYDRAIDRHIRFAFFEVYTGYPLARLAQRFSAQAKLLED